jgi:hypothetical protein
MVNVDINKLNHKNVDKQTEKVAHINDNMLPRVGKFPNLRLDIYPQSSKFTSRRIKIITKIQKNMV